MSTVFKRWVLGGTLLLLGIPLAAFAEDDFTSDFPIDQCKFKTKASKIGNRYVILVPGRQLYLSNLRCVDEGECEELEEVWVTVLDQTRRIRFDGRWINTRVIEEFETVDGEIEEISKNFFAECKGTQDIYYFGENVLEPDDEGNLVPADDQWIAGKKGAEPGIIFPGGAFLLGSRYFQELAPEVAMDRGEHVAMGLEIEVPAGIFEDCVEVEETTPLEPDEVSTKVYCPDVGLVIDDDLELVAVFEDLDEDVDDDAGD